MVTELLAVIKPELSVMSFWDGEMVMPAGADLVGTAVAGAAVVLCADPVSTASNSPVTASQRPGRRAMGLATLILIGGLLTLQAAVGRAEE